MTVSLANVWIIFGSVLTIVGPLLATLTGALAVRLLAFLLGDFFAQVRTALSKILKKGG
jgi:membrane protein YqaA with SNARE-associated domain